MVVQVEIKIPEWSHWTALCDAIAPASQTISWDAVCVVSVLITYYQGFEPAKTLEKGFVGRTSRIPAN